LPMVWHVGWRTGGWQTGRLPRRRAVKLSPATRISDRRSAINARLGASRCWACWTPALPGRQALTLPGAVLVFLPLRDSRLLLWRRTLATWRTRRVGRSSGKPTYNSVLRRFALCAQLASSSLYHACCTHCLPGTVCLLLCCICHMPLCWLSAGRFGTLGSAANHHCILLWAMRRHLFLRLFACRLL